VESLGRTAWLVTTALLLLPAQARAQQLDYGVRSGVAWSSNVFGTAEDTQLNGVEEDPIDDYSLRLSPFAAVSDPDGDVTWSLRYQPTYEHYLHETDLDGFDQNAGGSVGWRFADRWTLRVNENFALYQSPVRFNESTGNAANPVILRVENSEIRSNQASAVLEYGLTRRDSLALITNYNFTTYSEGNGNDRNTPSAALFYQHILSERTSAGARFSWIQQSITRQSGQDDTTQFYNLAGTLGHAFSPTFRLEASAGPTFIDTTPADEFAPSVFGFRVQTDTTGQASLPLAIDADTCELDPVLGERVASLTFGSPCEPVGVLSNALAKQTRKVPTIDASGNALSTSGSGETDLTYFARLALIKDWETWHATLAYERANSDTATFGSSSVADSLETQLSWTPLRLWTFGLTAGISLQENTTDSVVPQQFVVANVPTPPGSVLGNPPAIAEIQSIIAEERSDAEKYRTESVSFSATRKLTEHSSAFAALYWYTQRQELDFPDDDVTRWNNLTLWIGLDWKFDPIRF